MTVMTTRRSRSALHDDVADFINAELALLDDRHFEEWMALFTEDGHYWAPIEPGQKDPESHVSLFFDTVPTMKTRIARLRHPRIYMQVPHSRTVHMTSNLQVTAEDETSVTARCNFVMLEYRPTRPQNIWGGRYDYILARETDGFRIESKKASLVSSDDQFPSLAIWF
ncbi:aromatic-ring-hydroxylating dioxygenase subunit beta [soil metagenome]